MTTAFWVLSAAVAVGAVLFAGHLGAGKIPARAVGYGHAALGIAGFVLLVVALMHRQAMEDRYGIAVFAPVGAIFVAIALVLGLVIAFRQARSRRRRIRLPIVGAHATIAVTGYVLLLAYVALG
jgi:hypothetical protein